MKLTESKITFEIVTWPEIQTYMEYDGFKENSSLANSEHDMDLYGSSAYYVNSKWKEKVDEKIYGKN